MGTNQLTVSGGVLLINGTPVGGGGSVGTLQTVTNNGATTTNPISIQSSPGVSAVSISATGTAGGIQVFGGGNIQMGTGTAVFNRTINLSAVNGDAEFNGQLRASGLTYPATDGTAGQVLSTNGSGTLSWVTAGGGSVGTLQTVTNNGATTTNSVTLDRVGLSGTPLVIRPDANGKGISVLGNGAIEFLSPSGGQFYSSIQPGFESLSIAVAFGGSVINVNSLTTQITNQLQASGLSYPTSDGTSGQVLTTNGAGVLSWASGSGAVSTLQQVTTAGNTTTNTIRLFDSVTTNEAITLDPQTGLISILPQALGDPGLYLSPTGATVGNSVGSFRSAGLFPCAVQFNGSAGASLQTAGDGFPVQLWAGGTSLIGSPQVSVTGTATTVTNQLIASSLSYPTTDGTAGQVLSTNGSGTLGWITTAKVVATPGSSAAGGNDNEISFDAAGNFYFFKGGSWWKVAGSSF
jgi:hypothetical protein